LVFHFESRFVEARVAASLLQASFQRKRKYGDLCLTRDKISQG